MKKIESKFRADFKYWKIRLPKEDVALRRRGTLSNSGWAIWYLFGSDERGEYLDYYASHRMADDRHVRIYADGGVQDLPSISTFRTASLDPMEEDKRLDAEYQEENARIVQLLEGKGFGITGEEPAGVLINRALRTGAAAQHPSSPIRNQHEGYMNSTVAEVRKLADYLQQLEGFHIYAQAGGFDHMGATLGDAVLQAGIGYDTVVRPRVDRIKHEYPQAKTTTGFQSTLRSVGTTTVLSWAEGKKTKTLEALVALLAENGVESEADLREWMSESAHIETLKEIKGIGDKTVDYLRILCGLDAVAVDVHVRKLVSKAGIQPGSYDHVKSLVTKTAEAMSVPCAVLDYSIWKYMTNTRKATPKAL